jgi:hypothetical protein
VLGSARWLLRLAPDPVGGSAAEHAAREELRKAQYHRDDPSLFSRVVTWLLRRLDVLLSGSPAGNALLVLLVLLAAVVIFAVVHAGPPRRAARLRGPDAEDPLRPLASADHRRLAADFEAQGRHAEALREWLRAAVRSIEDRGVLPPLPGRTGAATAREAGPLLPAAADGLRAATLAFDEVWFGGRDATAADVELARTTADAVLSARVGQPARTPSAPGYALPW